MFLWKVVFIVLHTHALSLITHVVPSPVYVNVIDKVYPLYIHLQTILKHLLIPGMNTKLITLIIYIIGFPTLITLLMSKH